MPFRLVEDSRTSLACGSVPCTAVIYRVDLYPPVQFGPGYTFWVRTSLIEPHRITTAYTDIGAGGLRAPLSIPLPAIPGAQPRIAGSYQRGVALRVAAFADDGSVQVYTEVFPFPVEARDGECRIWAELASRQGEVWVIRGHGFVPGEALRVVTAYEGARGPVDTKADQAGELPAVVIAAPVAARSVHGAVEVVAAACRPRVDLDFGAAALTPAR